MGVVTALWGAALFATDSGPAPLLWVWPGDLLTSRLIAVMLFAIAVGAATSWRSAPLARMMLAMVTVYGLGLALASAWNALLAKPVQPSYLVAFGLMGLISAFLLVGGLTKKAVSA